MPTTATPSYSGTYQRMLNMNITASNDTQSLSFAHGISFTDNTATSVIEALLQVVLTPNGTQAAASQPLWYVSAIDATNVTLATYASGASAIGGAGNYAVWMTRVHTINR